MTSERSAWLEARKKGIGSSDAAALWEQSPWRTPLMVWSEKLGLIPPPDETEMMRLGKRLEPVVAAYYAERSGRKVELMPQDRVATCDATPYLLCTPDALQTLPDDRKAVLEIKTASPWKADEWEMAAPLGYQIQVQHQMIVLGLHVATIAVLIGGQELKWIDVPRNDSFVAAHLRKCEAFWRMIEREEPPVPTADDRETLAKLYPEHVAGKTVELSTDAEAWATALEAAKVACAHAKKAVEENENRLRQAMGDAETALIPDGSIYTLKTQHRRGYMVDSTSFRVLRRKGE